jgi:hypothetical protein
MSRSSSLTTLAGAFALTFSLAGCGSFVGEATDDALVIRGSAGAPTSDGPGHEPQGNPPGGLIGNPAAIKLSLQGLYLGTNPDCTDLVRVEDYGTNPVEVDLVNDPVLFSVNPPDGTYACVVFRMSDLVRVRPQSDFGGCSSATEYMADIYREGGEAYLDVDGQPTLAHGTDDAPQSDLIALVMTTNVTAAKATGFSTHQIVPLANALTVPGTATFFWNGDGTVMSVEGMCGVNPGSVEFH